MERLVIIDGHAILHRAYHAVPPLTTSNGKLVNAVFGFTSMLLRVIQNLKPTHVIVTFDLPKPTFRNKIYADYQSNRPKMDKELADQIDLVHKVVERMGIPIFEVEGYEADDVIATLARQVSGKLKTQNSKLKSTAQNLKPQENIETIIVTGDRDLLQLVQDYIKVYMPIMGLSKSKLFGEEEVEAKFGIKPRQIVDYKALVGDSSDNYPGVPGIGPKTAAGVLSTFKTLDRLYQQIDRVENESLRKKLKEHLKSVELAKKLATIVTDVPIKVDLEKCKLRNLDRPNVHQLFEELEFRSLIPRLSANNRQQTTDNKKQRREDKKKSQNIEQTTLF